MAEHRDFDAEARERLERIGLATLTMGGETFTLRDDVPPDILKLWDSIGPDSKEAQGDQLQMLDDVFVALVVPEDGQVYLDLRASQRTPGMMTLLSAAQWAVEQLTNRPFDQPAASGGSGGTVSRPASSTGLRSLDAARESERSASAIPAT
jgi:hypothetical protein